MSSLEVYVLSARNLPNLEYFDKSDPYTIVEFQGRKFQTTVKKSDLNPKWDERFAFNLEGKPLVITDVLLITVMDKEQIGNDRLLGQAEIPLKDLIKVHKESEIQAPLVDANNRPNAAIISLKMVYNGPKLNRDDDDDDPGDSQATDKMKRNKSIRQTFEEDDDDEGGTDGNDGTDQGGQKKKKGKRRGKSGKRKLRHTYSDKVQDYQVRIKVIEARQLQGANISPVTKVQCWTQTKQTRVKNSTNSPFWGDTFFFNFHASPADLFDELIIFSVYNSRRLRGDAMIGSFKFDLGMIYEEEQHCFLNKWLLLYDHEDPMAGGKGYLKFSAAILGHGDEAPSFAVAADEEDDIEANLLRPAGVQLRPATFTLRVYRAEDLPRMDSDVLEGIKKVFTNDTTKKELVDPYLIFQFAGKEIKTSTKFSSDHPEWNEELKIGLQFPSMCERIKLQMFDWDRLTEDDIIGTAIIDLSHIAAQGDNGFLPTFGPCFINFYGSPREFSNLPDKFEALNWGKGEGVAYRGRLMIELSTTLDETPEPDQEMQPINQDNLLKAQKFLRRRKYRLHAAFISASMITATDTPVEFEVSMGNYGNKLDETLSPSSSTTQPTNAIFDGSYYHFLPWGNSKPCTVVDCHWEEVSSRLYTVNFLLKILDKLTNNINKIKVAVKADLPEEEQAQFVISAFDDLIMHCNKDLPSWEAGESPLTDLDLNLQNLRTNELNNIRKEALKIREEATSVEHAQTELEALYNQLKNLAVEPQNSMPDVVIWMITGQKRTVYYRIPSYDVLYSSNPDYMGRHCGSVQTINLKVPSIKDSEVTCFAIPGQLRLKLWLGQEKDELEWYKMQTEGDLSILAETYENQASLMGSWTTRAPMMTRPPWSDSSGRVELKKDLIHPPSGWNWDGDWYISPELSLFYDKDAGLSQYLEDVFVCETRVPNGSWGPAVTQFTDIKGDPCPAPKDIALPPGWEWEDEWQVDLNRPCDEEGWEYTVEASMGGYVPVEKMYHMCRRRRYVRPRKIVDEALANQDSGTVKPSDNEHWEFAPLFEMRFHAKERKTDMVRRRRWHRKMKPAKAGTPFIFNLNEKEPENGCVAVPRMFLVYKKPHKWQLRAYIYQARNLLAGDQTGFSDPYARVALLNQSQCTERIDKTLCPTWDQTLIFYQVEIYGNPMGIVENPPFVIVEVFDYDQIGEDEFLGRCQITPMVKTNPGDSRKSVLQWYNLTKGTREAGELLAAFELFLVTDKPLPFTPPKRGDLYTVPDGIRPMMQRTGLEILSWGVRNMSKYHLSNVSSPSIEFEIGGHVIQTDIIKNTALNPNFENPLLFLDVLLPKEELYMPPFNIKVRDNRAFGRRPLVGMHVLNYVDEYRYPVLVDEGEALTDFAALRNTGALDGNPIEDDPLGTRSDQISREYINCKCCSGDNTLLLSNSCITDSNLCTYNHACCKDNEKSILFCDDISCSIIDDNKPCYTKMMDCFMQSDNQTLSYLHYKCNDCNPYGDVSHNEFQNTYGFNSFNKWSDGQNNQSAIDKEMLLKRQTNPYFGMTKISETCSGDEMQLQTPKKKKGFKLFTLTAKGPKRKKEEGDSENVLDLTLMDEDIDWWSKYYASLGEWGKCNKYQEMNYDTFQIYKTELEKVEGYNDFTDFCSKFLLYRGKNLDDEDESSVGEFKGTFRIYPLPENINEKMPPKYLEKGLPSSFPVDCIVRVYIIRAIELQPNDPSGLADPYVEVQLGKKMLSNKDAYVPNNLNPEFGRMFELKCTIPIQKDLEIRVKDYDFLSSDDVIGETFIDLENRFLTKYRATCGLPQTYCISGPNKWRDCVKPTDILKDFCTKNFISLPVYTKTDHDEIVQVGQKQFKISNFERNLKSHHHLGPSNERLALHVLNILPLVKEHIETRPLFSPLQPGIEQGKLQMWIDIFPGTIETIGEPFEITPRKPKSYQLRIIVWNTKDVILEDENLLGEKMSDIYVKGWLAGIDERQETDVHYRSLDGEGNFNWRFVFPFQYLPAENMMIVKKKEHFWSLDETEQRLPCSCVLQIWDNDKFSADDFLGTLELNLAKMPAPAKKSKQCDLNQLPAFNPNLQVKQINLFECRRAYGYWPCYNDETGVADLTGKIEMELELLTEEEAAAKPAGLGRDEPNENPKLDPPKRPDTSFFWFTSPWKTFKFIIWKNFKWYFIGGIIILLVALIVVLFFYSLPGLTARKMVGV